MHVLTLPWEIENVSDKHDWQLLSLKNITRVL